jgi:3-oxoacyl-[acyl-carrier-protein] synthase II
MSIVSKTERRVVVTGMGILSPIGIGRAPFWDSLREGRSGLSRIEMFDCSIIPGGIGGEIKDFDEETAKKVYLKAQRKSIKVMCRDIQLGVASAALAMEDAGLDLEAINHDRFGVEFGANLMLSPPGTLSQPNQACVDDRQQFRFESWGDRGLGEMEPLWLLKYLPNMPACHIGIFAEARGPNNSLTLEDASANLSIKEAASIIRRGWADVMIAGATGARVHPVEAVHAVLWHETFTDTDDPLHAVRPFDLNRCGTTVGEGACTFILEEESHAKARGAAVLGTYLGGGASCAADAAGKPDLRRSIANAMRVALKSARLAPDDIGHINAHGLGVRHTDLAEAQAIHDVFGAQGGDVPVVSLKGYMGNSGAGDGALELAASLLAVREGLAPQTLNYTTPDPDCGLNVVHDEPLAVSNKTVMNVSYTRIGQASVVIVRGE